MFLSLNSLISQYQFVDTKSGKEISLEDLAEKLSNHRFILFGEFHDDSLIHIVQYELFKKIHDENENLVLSMEMFERDVQNKVNEYLDGAITKEEFLKSSRPWPDYQKFYAPMVDFAKDKNLRVLAANIPRKYAGLYVREGMTGIRNLPADEQELVTTSMMIRDDIYMSKFFETMTGSADKIKELPANEQNTLYLYYGSQVIKDETMAESIVRYAEEHPDKIIYHLNGDFHSNSYLGTAQKITDRLPEAKPVVITPIYYKDKSEIGNKSEYSSLADYVLFVPEMKRDEPQMDMASMSHFGENNIVDHKIEIDIDPASSSIKGKDKVTYKNPILKTAHVDLLNTLKITKVEYANVQLEYKIEKLNDNYNRIIFDNPTFEYRIYGEDGVREEKEITIHYEGTVYNKPNETTLVQRHSNSIGIISDKDNEGIYLPGSAFYPKTEQDMANFDCKITIPSEFTLVTSFIKGSLNQNNKTTYEIKSDFQIDDLTLVGGRLKKVSEKFDKFTVNLFTYQDLPNSETFTKSIKEYYDLYTGLFGEYPFSDFSVVENFFATGFGMPGYTLLSGRLLKMPWVVLSPGSIAHEFVHNWWGNSVFVDYEKGNWCEALTTFSSNYYYHALNSNDKELVNWRKKALIELDALPTEKNYPVKEFKYQKDIFDAAIGYQKGAFIFIEMMKLMGKEAFFDALKSFATKNKGKRAFWMNLTSEFDMRAKQDKNPYQIRSIFNKWLANKDLPEYKIQSIDFDKKDDSNKVTISIRVKNPIQTKLPIVFVNASGNKKELVEIKDTINTFTFDMPADCSEIQVDPDYENLRKVFAWEKPYNFNRTLSSKPIVVIPDKSNSDYNTAIKFIDKLKESDYNFAVYEISQVNDELIKNNSLLILGNYNNNSLINSMKDNLSKYVMFNLNKLQYKGNEYPIKTISSLINTDHPNNPEKLCSVIYFDGLPDEKMLTRYFHYMSYSYLALELNNPRGPIQSGEIFPNIENKEELRVKINK